MADQNILLIGAGFSSNWDAPTTREVASTIAQEVGSDTYLQALLKQHDKNFENALSEVQRAYVASPALPVAKDRLDKLQAAITKMFYTLNVSIERRTNFEFSLYLDFSVRKFLARFDAIFGLNQDLLMELQYEEHVQFASHPRWAGMQMPGMIPIFDPSIVRIDDKHRRRWKPSKPSYTVDARLQPYYKMHGSSNWYTDDGQQLLVMGGNKELMLRQHAVLRWYYDEFKRRLQGGAKLMVIGYSFGDEHINKLILEAWQNRALRGIFIVDPCGRDVLNPTRHLPMPMHSDLEDIVSLGASTRLLSHTFAGDEFEFQKFDKFFKL